MSYKKTITVLLCLLLLMAVLAGCDNTQQPTETTGQTGEIQEGPKITQGAGEEPTAPGGDSLTEPAPYENEPTEPPVQVVMPEYELSYSGVMKESISWEEMPEAGGLQFYIALSNGKVPIFTMLLNQVQGEKVEMVTNSAGQQIPVTFLMEEPPAGLSDEDALRFGMAQEIVNDVANSLKLK